MSDFARNTKIVITSGPAVASPQIAKKILQAGVDVIRLNFSHGTYAFHSSTIKLIRSLSENDKSSVAILIDLQGPKIRTGSLKNGKEISLRKGDNIKIISSDVPGEKGLITTNYTNLFSDLQKDNRILIDDGSIALRVRKKSKHGANCTVITGGMLGEHKGINLPDTKLKLPSLTQKDKRDLEFALEQGIDYVALSFVRQASDIVNLKKYMNKLGYFVPVIAKIETPQAVENINQILDKAEGVMVARGDLGVEMRPQMVPIAQKTIVKKANQCSRLVIIATQMLDSMIRNPQPTRAEVSDVANAIFDGADAIMLSGETAIGKYPLEAIKMMSDVAFAAEENSQDSLDFKIRDYEDHQLSLEKAIAPSACYVARKVKAKAIIVYTLSGATALYISKQRPQERIIALTPHRATYYQMNLYWNVTPILSQLGNNPKEMLVKGEKALLKKRLLRKGDRVVVVSGTSFVPGATNMIKIHTLGNA